MPVIISNAQHRRVLVRYFLDRPGASIDSSSAVFWDNPPEVASATDIKNYLRQAGITTQNVFAQVYIPDYSTYMSLDALEGEVSFSFRQSNEKLDIRLTTNDIEEPAAPQSISKNTVCSMSPLGLFAFSMLICMHTAEDIMVLTNEAIADSYKPLWACYAFWIGGFLQLWVGGWEATRNNIYGATAFSAFGCFWLANGTFKILSTFYNLPVDEKYHKFFPIGGVIKDSWILLFVFVLFKQTLVMNRLSTSIIVVLASWIIATLASEYFEPLNWIKVALGCILCSIGMYAFFAELTNEVYPGEPMPIWPVHKENTEIVGAAGRSQSLTKTVLDLRTKSGKQDFLSDNTEDGESDE